MSEWINDLKISPYDTEGLGAFIVDGIYKNIYHLYGWGTGYASPKWV